MDKSVENCHLCGQEPVDGKIPLHKCKHWNEEFYAMLDIVTLVVATMMDPTKAGEIAPLMNLAVHNYMAICKKVNYLDGLADKDGNIINDKVKRAMEDMGYNVDPPDDVLRN